MELLKEAVAINGLPPTQFNAFATFRFMIALFDEVNSDEDGYAGRVFARANFFEETLAKGKENSYSSGAK